jgi:hypothetical protein
MCIVEDLHARIGSISLKLNLDYIMRVVNVFFELLFPPPSMDEQTKAGEKEMHRLLAKTIEWVPPDCRGQPMYLKKCKIDPYDIHLVFNSNPMEAHRGHHHAGDDDDGESRGHDSPSYLASLLGHAAASIVGGIAYVTPEFKIKPVVLYDTFLTQDFLLYDVILWGSLYADCIKQLYKIVGSVELLGDPIGLLNEVRMPRYRCRRVHIDHISMSPLIDAFSFVL